MDSKRLSCSWSRLEPDPLPGRVKLAAVHAGVLALAFALASGGFAAYGMGALEAYGTLLEGTLGDRQGLSEVLRRTIPLLLIGSGLTLAFRVSFFNIGAEGQLLLGAAAGGAVAAHRENRRQVEGEGWNRGAEEGR